MDGGEEEDSMPNINVCVSASDVEKKSLYAAALLYYYCVVIVSKS